MADEDDDSNKFMGGKLEVKPSTPGQWSDEDEARLQGTSDSAVNGMISKTGPGLMAGKGISGVKAAGSLAKSALGYKDGGLVGKRAQFQKTLRGLNG